MYPLIIYPLAPSDMVQERSMTTGPMSNLERTDGLDTSAVVEDAGEGGGHDDEKLIGRYQ